MDIDKLVVALMGDAEMGLVGMLERFKAIEESIMKGRKLQQYLLIGVFALSVITNVYLIFRFGV